MTLSISHLELEDILTGLALKRNSLLDDIVAAGCHPPRFAPDTREEIDEELRRTVGLIERLERCRPS